MISINDFKLEKIIDELNRDYKKMDKGFYIEKISGGYSYYLEKNIIYILKSCCKKLESLDFQRQLWKRYQLLHINNQLQD